MAELINFLVENAKIVLIGSVTYFILLWVALIFWTANDLTRRPASLKLKIFSLALVMVGNVFGFVIYLIIRPATTYEEKDQEDLERKLVESQVKSFYCKACEFPVREDFVLCPNCLKKLKNVCQVCTKLIEVNWLACPYCGFNRLNLPQTGPILNLEKPVQNEDTEVATLENSHNNGHSVVTEVPVKRGRGRPRKNVQIFITEKNPLDQSINQSLEVLRPDGTSETSTLTITPLKRGRGRPRKHESKEIEHSGN